MMLYSFANKYIFKSNQNSAIFVSVFNLLFFSYGYVLKAFFKIPELLKRTDLFAVVNQFQPLMKYMVLIMWTIIILLFLHLLLDKNRNNVIFSKYLTLLSIPLLGFVIFQAFYVPYQQKSLVTRKIDFPQNMIQEDLTSINEDFLCLSTPDIYYLIIDGYARSDVMVDMYNFDNTDFMHFLKERGFYLASNSSTNYNYTFISLASSLNYDYLTFLNGLNDKNSKNIQPVMELLRNNRLFHKLNICNYETIISPGPFSEDIPSDVRIKSVAQIDAFQNELINASPLRVIMPNIQYQQHRLNILNQLELLSSIEKKEKPIFVLAHILSPHPPFVFNRLGEPVNPNWEFTVKDNDDFTIMFGQDAYVKGYSEQAVFITSKLELLIDKILTLDPKPIIILQSDHGPGSQHDGTSYENTNITERYPILNALYFPDFDYKALYPSITPVNTFRVILNKYFRASYTMLMDRNYYIKLLQPYEQIDITDRLNQKDQSK